MVEAYVGDGTTYARLGRRWDIHRSTAYRRLMKALGDRCTLLSRTRRRLSKCDGVCFLDAKHLRLKGTTFTIYVAWDRGFGRPVHFLLKEGGETDLWYWRLLVDLKHLEYVPKAFVSDGYPALRAFISDAYPDLPHQRCIVHVFMWMRSVIAPGKRAGVREQLFVGLARDILWSRSLAMAKRRLEKLEALESLLPKERKALSIMENALEQAFTYAGPRWKHLHLPRSSNAIENVMGQIEARLKTRRGAKSFAATKALLNEVLLRVKRQIINQ